MPPGIRIMQILFSLEKTVYTNKMMHCADIMKIWKTPYADAEKHFSQIETGDE